MSINIFQYSVTGTPAEILREYLSEGIWLSDLHGEDHSNLNLSDMASVIEYAIRHAAHSSIPAIYRWVREEMALNDPYFTPECISNGGCWTDEMLVMADRAFTSEQHYHWAFAA